MNQREPVSQPSGETIANLPNLGAKSQAMLAAAGITKAHQLRELGSVAAYLKVKAVVPSASLNLLWAIEGGLSGQSWQEVARHQRTSLLLSLEHEQYAHQLPNHPIP